MRQALPVLVMIVATHLYVRVDVLMLTYWTDRETVARYGSAYAFLDQLMILSNFMMGALFPNFARVALARGVEYRTLYRGILLLFGKYLLPIAVLIAIFSRSLLAGVYGPEYSQAGVALSILMVAALFAWINGPAGTIFISLGKQSLYMWATIVSLVVNIIGNIILIPLVGAIGSAIATVLTEAALCIVCLVWIHQITGWLPWMEINERRDGT
jgi:O-antigen/teichoic acid export membrane protein